MPDQTGDIVLQDQVLPTLALTAGAKTYLLTTALSTSPDYSVLFKSTGAWQLAFASGGPWFPYTANEGALVRLVHTSLTVYVKGAGTLSCRVISLLDMVDGEGGGGGGGGSGSPSTFYVGTGAPDDGIGIDGDFYLQDDTRQLYQKGGGTWGVEIVTLGAHPAFAYGSGVPASTPAFDSYYLDTAVGDWYRYDDPDGWVRVYQFDASSVALGTLPVARGGTGSDLSATGGASQVLRQSSAGAGVTVSQLSHSDISGLGTAATKNAGSAGGVADLDGGGQVPVAQLPAIAITDTFVVVSEVAMLALSAQTGDVAVRTDTQESYILQGTDPTDLADWQLLLSPADGVLSVDLAMPAEFDTSGGPVTSTGTLTASWASQASGNQVFATPDGTGGTPAFRALVAADIPNLSTAKLTSGTLPVARGGTNSATALSGASVMVTDGTSVVQGAAGTATTVLHGNAAGVPTYGAVSLTADVSGVLPVANGGTNSTTALSGSSIMVSDGTHVVQGAAGTATTLLHGNAAGVPTYGAVALATDVSGVLPVANGGTGAATTAAHTALVGPTSGSAAAPTWRQPTNSDVATAFKLAVRAVATANTSVSSAPAAIDGVTLSSGDRVLLTGQTTPAEMGLWVFGAAADAMTRPEDYASANTVEAFKDIQVQVREGTAGAGTSWRLTTTGAITIDTTGTAWSQVTYSVGTGGITGVLPIANGGTNSSAALSGSSIMVSDGSKVVQGTAGTATTVLHGNASGAPTYGAVSLTADVSGVLPIANGGTAAATATANRIFAGPASGAVAAPSFRAQVPADLPGAVALVDAATIATNAALGSVFDVTLGGNRTLGNPTNPTDGQKVTWRIRQDGSGNRTLAFDTKFRFGTDVVQPTMSTTAAKTDHIGAQYNLADDKWDVLAVAQGY